MYIHVCVCMYVCMYVHMYVCTCVYTYVCVCVCAYVCVLAFTVFHFGFRCHVVHYIWLFEINTADKSLIKTVMSQYGIYATDGCVINETFKHVHLLLILHFGSYYSY
jgi:hypothetical protein